MEEDKTGYAVLEVQQGNPDEITQIFVGKKGDGKYHLLGDRPKELRHLFSERACSCLDEGIIELPPERRSLSDLVVGDVIRVTGANGEEGPFNGAKYVRRV